jgi:hypothetical protein
MPIFFSLIINKIKDAYLKNDLFWGEASSACSFAVQKNAFMQ